MEGRVLGNRYEIICRVGTGGMAVVYKAKDNMLNRFVAIKILREEFKENEEFIRRFKVESQAAASLSHQNIVQVYDVGEEDGLHYIVMELLEGQTLKQYMTEKGGRLSWREAANFSMQICRALEHAHSKHVVHRDIKPQNIIITEGNKLKVADFGIARAANNSTMTNTLTNAVGSAHYLSPEQAHGTYTDNRSDIYSLGVVMYEMFTGRLPFDAEESLNVIMQHLHDEPIAPCKINEDIPRGIEAIIMRAMMKEPRLRYDNATQILEDLVEVYQHPDIKISMLNASDGKENSDEVQENRRRQVKKSHAKKKKKVNKGLIAFASIFLAIVIVVVCAGISLFFIRTGGETEVPDLRGLTYKEAAVEAENAGKGDVVFTVTVDRSEHSSRDKDTIISQIPEGGSKVKRSREIRVVISLGEIAARLEDYTGEDFNKIEKELTALGIKVIKKETDSDTYTEGIIVKQIPAEGTELAEGDEITLYVSAGTKNTVVPDVVGKTLDEAIVIIERNNLKVGIVRESANSKYAKGKIFKQSKDSFETVPVGSSIDLYVSSGEEESAPSVGNNDNSDNKPVKKTHTLTLGNLPKDREKVNIRLVLDGQTFYEKDFPTSGGTANITIEVTESVSLDVYYDGVYTTTKEVKY